MNAGTNQTITVVGLLVAMMGAAGRAAGESELAANRWVTSESKAGLSCAGAVYAPAGGGVMKLGYSVYDPAQRKWVGRQPKAGRWTKWLGRHSYFAEWTKENGHELPVLPRHNRGYWPARQFCYAPALKKLVFFMGGLTFLYDPAEGTYENRKVGWTNSPPDVMLGSMAWDPVNKEVVLFGGGYLRAYQAHPGDVRQYRPKGSVHEKDWDRRGTWAFNPESNTWRKLKTASEAVVTANAALDKAADELQTLWGRARAAALDYWKRVDKPAPAEVGKSAAAMADRLKRWADDHEDKGQGEYEAWQHASASDILRTKVVPELESVATELKDGDRWVAFHAVERARVAMIEARETMAVAPRPRHYACLTTVPDEKAMVLWGGDGEDRFFADTWLLHLDTHRWERCRVEAHPPVSGRPMVSMDYDSRNKRVVLAHPNGSLWAFDLKGRRWASLNVANAGATGGGQFRSLAYDESAGLHVLAVDHGRRKAPKLITGLLRLDIATAGEEKAGADNPDEAWRPQYGAGTPGNRANKRTLAWKHLPRNQTEYRVLLAKQEAFFKSLPPNRWVAIKTPYEAWGRAYGSFCYDWDRDELVLWGGGHSAYMGNEFSQYSVALNRWMESWNPEYPPHPYGSPDGPGWTPSFYHIQGSGHGYHGYVYCGALRGVTINRNQYLYDPDRMRLDRNPLRKVGPGSLSVMTEMNGAPGLMSVGTKHWYGGPFGVWRADFEAGTLSRIPGPQTPFSTNDRAKNVYDPTRNQVIFYGTRDHKDRGLYVFDIKTATWKKIDYTVEGKDAPNTGPRIRRWDYGYSPKHDIVLIGSEGTWALDRKTNRMRKVSGGGSGPGIVYSARYDIFLTISGHGYRPQTVSVFRYDPKAPMLSAKPKQSETAK